jgi:tryptophan-rich sensory protein
MGIASFLIWKSEHPRKKQVLTLYFLQLFLNFLWSPAFFGAQNPMLGILVILPLWGCIIACIFFFRKINTWAAVLMIPYLLWVSFATVLNATIWYLNS